MQRVSYIFILLFLGYLSPSNCVAATILQEHSAGLQTVVENQEPTLSSTKYAEILTDKEHPIDARILALLTLSEKDVTEAKLVFARVDATSSNFNAAEQYIMFIIKANLASKSGHENKVINWLNQALALSEKIDKKQLNLPMFIQVHLKLADNYAALKQFEQAYQEKENYLNKYREHRLEVRDTRLNKLNKKYETDLKRKQNELLASQNKLKSLKIQEAEDEQASHERNVVILIITAIVFMVLLFRQMNVRSRLRYLAKTDSLTGLYNRRTLFEKGHEITQAAEKTAGNISAILLDVDHFKNINDSFGHDVGDKVISEIAKLGSETMRSRDVFARLGGEEFAAILPGTSLEEAKAIAERLREKVSQLVIADNDTINVTISAGVSNIGQVSFDFDSLLAAADEAMYSAKHKGRNKVCSFAEKLSV